MRAKKIMLALVVFLTISGGYTFAILPGDGSTSYCKDDGICAGVCQDNTEGGKTCRAQDKDQNCSSTGS